MNELQNFQHPELGSIRAVEIDGEPWLVGKGQQYFIDKFLGGENT